MTPAPFISLKKEPGIAVLKRDFTRAEAIGAYLAHTENKTAAFSIREGLVCFRQRSSGRLKVQPGWYEVKKRTNGVFGAWLIEEKNGPI